MDHESARPARRTLVNVGWVTLVGLVCLFGSLPLDLIPLSAARPPSNIKTIADFHSWKRGAVIGQGTFAEAGTTYTVLLAPAGRYLASGPSAYLFDEQGRFIDWTADMGDFKTAKNRFDLTSGRVESVEIK